MGAMKQDMIEQADAEARRLRQQNGSCECCGEPIETAGERHCIACREVADDGE